MHRTIVRRARTAGRVLVTAAAAVVLVLALAVTMPRLFGYQTYAITSGSMAGAIEAGSLVVARSVPTGEVGIGDVITYVPPAETGIDHPVTHRVVAIEPGDQGTIYRTKGDANDSVDPWSFELDADHQSVVEFSVPAVGRFVLGLSDPTRRQLAIGVPALAIALSAAVELVRELRSRRGGRGGTGLAPRPQHAPTS